MLAEPGDFVVGDDSRQKIFGILLGLVHVHDPCGTVVSDEADILPVLEKGPLIRIRTVPHWEFHQRDPGKSELFLLQMGFIRAPDGSYRTPDFMEPLAARVLIPEPTRPIVPGLPKMAAIIRHRAPQG